MAKGYSRRSALKRIAAAGAGFVALGSGYLLLRRRLGGGSPLPGAGGLEEFSPVDRTLGELASERFHGDDVERAHSVFWHLSEEEASPDEEVPVVVVGGGMSGLATAYLLRDLNPVVLEQAPRFGGNSRAQSWRGLNYSIGAAYLVLPDPGSELESFYREIGIDRIWRAADEASSTALLDSGQLKDVWHKFPGGRDVARARDLLREHFIDVLKGRNGQEYPEVPVPAGLGPEQRARLESLDGLSFEAHLREVLGGPIPPAVRRVIEQYCWSSFGASMSELSAMAGLNFYAGEFSGIAACPGGNAKVAEALVEHLHRDLPPGSLRPGCAATRVSLELGGGARVTYLTPAGTLRAIRAQRVVMACPKFVAARILKGLDPDRDQAFRSLEYRAFYVANALLDGKLPSPSGAPGAAETAFYEMFLMKGPPPAEGLGTAEASRAQGATDVISANFAQEHPEATVLTLYQSLPYTGGRPEALTADLSAVRARLERQLRAEVLPSVEMGSSRIVDLRVARWGHPLPVAKPGYLGSGLYDRLRAPFGGRIYFVEQDNWCLPAIETALGEALHWAPLIRESLKS
ncbi:MAG: FAD-dependent oxidoreductase [Bdellovibrionales bacterium]|nr:FAD-dependent oxidoreductase [Bdellovibrionales bacterium]